MYLNLTVKFSIVCEVKERINSYIGISVSSDSGWREKNICAISTLYVETTSPVKIPTFKKPSAVSTIKRMGTFFSCIVTTI